MFGFVNYSYLKDSALILQQLEAMESFKLGVWKGYYLSIERIQQGYPFHQKWYIKGWGVGPWGGAYLYQALFSISLEVEPHDC